MGEPPTSVTLKKIALNTNANMFSSNIFGHAHSLKLHLRSLLTTIPSNRLALIIFLGRKILVVGNLE